MAKNAPKTNALGMNLDPDSFAPKGDEAVKGKAVDPAVVADEKVVKQEPEVPNEERSGSIDEVLKEIANPRNDKRKGYSLYLSESVMKEATKRARAAGVTPPR